jgi:hypothetical protein
VTPKRPNHAAVRDYEDGLVRMVVRDRLDRADDPPGQVVARLAVVSDVASEPARLPRGKPLAHLVSRQTRPGADVDLA